MEMSYEEAQRRRICPYCEEVGERAKGKLKPNRLYTKYECRHGHEYYIDERYFVVEEKSEVAAIRAQIDQEFEAMRPQFALGARHKIVASRYRNIDSLHVRLVPLIGDQAASDMLVECNENAMRNAD